ncbi:MAG TPA: GldM family protein [Flavobacterium sp.]|jgi:hypothetical protein|nr:hypothetical protein [Flavobacterium sp.]HQX05084.1 GldM family protein [Flavobacterium sp.]HRZ31610.1 GldM family protein [Flavobacterium sp.]HRZ75553.1 GldM family protein [Flavobacterium sp.]
MKTVQFICCLLLSQFLLAQSDTSFVSKPKLGLISVDKLNVVYRGIRNPISIAVPNAKSFTVSGLGVSQEKGNYYISPGQGNEMIVTLEIVLEDDSKVIEEHVFRIKNIGNPLGRINNRNCKDCIIIIQKLELQNAEISVYFEDLLTGIKLNVSSFSIELSSKTNLEISGNKIDEETYKQLIRQKNNSEFKIHNIYYTESLLGCFPSAGVINVRISD